MTAKAYKDFDGNYLDSDYVIFDEEVDIDDTYNTEWDMDDEDYYKMILEENQYIASLEFKNYL